MSPSDFGPAEWHVSVNGAQSGPHTVGQIVGKVADGDIDDRDFVWREGMEKWVPLLEVGEIDDALWAEGIRFPGSPYDDEEPADNPALRAVVPVGRTGWSIVAGYLGLISLFLPPLAPIAIIVSICAIIHLQNNPEKHGMGRAIFGIVAGVLGIVIGILIVVNMN